MSNPHFISYSSADAQEFALKLANALIVGPPSFPVWLDKRGLHPGGDWDSQLDKAIKSCESMIFVMSRDSVENESVCKQEWTRAFRYKKAVTPILLQRDVEMPFRFGARQFIDFTGDFNIALARLQNHLQWLASPEGYLQALADRLADAVRDQRRANDPHEQQRTADEIALLQQQIAAQEEAIANPQAAAQVVQTRIETGLERERQPERPVAGEVRTKFINPPPGSAPNYFQDRHVETRLLVEQLKDENKRLLTVVGRGGVGKTAMVCRLLKGVEAGRLPDELGKELGELPVDGLVYLSQNAIRQISAANLFADLCKLLPSEVAQRMAALYRDPQVTTDARTKTLLTHFGDKRVLVLLDNLEDLIDPANRQLKDRELDETLQALLRAPVHGVRVICTTRIAAQGLALVQPQLQSQLSLDDGLESPYAENILKAMDADGKLGLKDAPDELLENARERTRGYPRALEALVAILASDRSTTLPELLSDGQRLLPEHVVETLVGEAYSRLDRTAQMVMQALAIYARSVTAAAVDYLLQPYLPAVDGAATLNRLVNMHFVRKEGDRYYLHPVDRSYALERVSEGAPGDGTPAEDVEPPPLTRYALWHRGANYFAQAKLPRSQWKRLEDLSAQLAEFDPRCTAQEYSTAADILFDIDLDYLLLWGHARLLVELHKRLLSKLSDPKQKSISLGRLGIACYSLGQVEQAIGPHQQALAIAKEIGDRYNESLAQVYLGNAQLDQSKTEEAILLHKQACLIADAIQNREAQSESNHGLALAQLVAGDLAAAAQTIAVARQHDYVPQNAAVLALQGVIQLRLGQLDVAQVTFVAAVAQANGLLEQSAQNYAALDTLGLAQTGVALCSHAAGDAANSQLAIRNSLAAYRTARAITSAPGIGVRALRLFDALAVADREGVFVEVRGAAKGEQP